MHFCEGKAELFPLGENVFPENEDRDYGGYTGRAGNHGNISTIS
jgi:hypothetical protein